MTTKIEIPCPTLPTDVSGLVSEVLKYEENAQSVSFTNKSSGRKITLVILARGGISRNPQSYRYELIDESKGGLAVTYRFTPYVVLLDQPISVKDNVLTMSVNLDMKPLIGAVETLKTEIDAFIKSGGKHTGITMNLFPPSKNAKRSTKKRAHVEAVEAEDGDYQPPQDE